MRRMDNFVGELVYDNLIISAGDVGHLRLEPNQGVLKRGSLVTKAERMVPSGEEGSTEEVKKDAELAVGGMGEAAYILTDDIDTSKETVATVYKNGKYVRESLILNGDITDTDIEALRTVGIIVESMAHHPARNA